MYKLFFPFFEIDYLANYPQFAPTIAGWFYAEWKQFYGPSTLDQVTASVRLRAKVSDLPLALIALYENEPVGTVTLKDWTDIGASKGAWLTGLYVVDKFRGHGIATQLMLRIEEEGRRLGCRFLQLWTQTAVDFYMKRGWEKSDTGTRYDRVTTVMRRSLWPNSALREIVAGASRNGPKTGRLPGF